MQKLLITGTMLTVTLLAPCSARDRHHAKPDQSASVATSTPSTSVNRDPTKAGLASPANLDSADAKVDRSIKSICRGC